MFKILALLLLTEYSSAIPKLDVPIQWSGESIDWPNETAKNFFSCHNKSVSKNVTATRIAIYNDQAIIALPRHESGIPITLAEISLKCKTDNRTMSAFPSCDQQEEGNCDALQSVIDVFLDPENILWALDTGVINSMKDSVRTCSPKVVGYNLKTRKLVKIIDLSSLTTLSSRLQYVISDYSLDGHNFIYVSDAGAGAIIVYNATLNQGYRILLPKKITDNLNHDILYLILLRNNDSSVQLLFSYLNGKRIYTIRAEYLQNDTAKINIVDIGAKPQNIIFLGTNGGNTVFFRYEDKADIYHWNSIAPFCPENSDIVSSFSDNDSLAIQVIPDYNLRRIQVLQLNFLDHIQGIVGCGGNHSVTLS